MTACDFCAREIPLAEGITAYLLVRVGDVFTFCSHNCQCGWEVANRDRYTLTESGYRAVMQQGAKLNGEVKAGEDNNG